MGRFNLIGFCLFIAGYAYAGDDRILDADFFRHRSSNANYVEVHAPDSLSATYSLTWPGALGAIGSVLTDTDGAGTLAWSAVPAPTLRLDLSETLDPDNLNSNRVNVYTNIVPIADSSASNINEFEVGVDNATGFAVNGVWTMKLHNNITGSANNEYNGIIETSQQIGNGTDPITLNQLRGIDVYQTVAATTTITSASMFGANLSGAPGSSIGDFSFMRASGGVDKFSQGVSIFESRMDIGEVENNVYTFNDNNHIIHAKQNILSYGIGNLWETVDGYVSMFNSSPIITTANDNVNTFVDNTRVDDMPDTNSGFYNSFNIGPNVTDASGIANGLSLFNTHANVQGEIRNDFNGWEDGSFINKLYRNLNMINLHTNADIVDGSANFLSFSPSIGVVNASYTDINLGPRVDDLALNYNGVQINPTVVGRALTAADFTFTPVPDVAGSLAGKSVFFGTNYSQGGQNYTPWFKVSGVGTAPGCCGNPIEVAISTGDSAATIATAMAAALNAYGSPLTDLMTITDIGGAVQIVAINPGGLNNPSVQDSGFGLTNTAFGAGDGQAVGLSINMQNATGFDPNNGVHGIRIDNADFNQSISYPLRSLGNAIPINSFNVTYTAPPSTTISGADNFSLASFANVNLGHDAHVSGGAFGIGSASIGMINLLQLDDGSTMADVAGQFVAFVPIGGTGAGGVVGTVHGYEVAGLPGGVFGSPTTITNAKAFEARTPAGPFVTGTAWGLYAESGYTQNYIGGSLKIGTGTDTTTAALDVQGGDALFDGDVIVQGGNVPHGYARRPGTLAATSAVCTAACNAGEIATGGGCENSLTVGLVNSILTDDMTQSCTYSSAIGDCTATVYCMGF